MYNWVKSSASQAEVKCGVSHFSESQGQSLSYSVLQQLLIE